MEMNDQFRSLLLKFFRGQIISRHSESNFGSAFLVGLCMFSLCMRGFSPGTQVFFHSSGDIGDIGDIGGLIRLN